MGETSSLSTTPWQEVVVRWGGSWLLLPGNSDRMCGNGIQLCQGKFSWEIRNHFFSERAMLHWHRLPRWCYCPWKCSRNMDMWHWGMWLVHMMGVGWWLDMMVLGVFSNLYDSVILQEHRSWEPKILFLVSLKLSTFFCFCLFWFAFLKHWLAVWYPTPYHY